MAEHFLDGKVILHAGNCLEVLEQLADNSVDSVVTDPPYHLTSIVQRFGAEDAAPPRFKTGAYGGGFTEANGGTGAAFARMSRGFMGKVWDGGTVAFEPTTWRALIRVLKPGGHLVACGGTRTFHRMACAIEDAGFEIRDTISWLYGSGFPKSHDVSKGIDRAAGAVREKIGPKVYAGGHIQNHGGGKQGYHEWGGVGVYEADGPAITATAKQWDGWGTALKPACELIVLARKPLSEKTVAANVLRWGTGAINVDGCRVEAPEGLTSGGNPTGNNNPCFMSKDNDPRAERSNGHALGRWPANVVHDGSDEVVAAFPETGASSASANRNGQDSGDVFSFNRAVDIERGHNDTGSAARFFYTSKADADDRLGSKHPTVKPLDLMQWLVRLVTPRGGVCLDPFSGTGTTGEAAFREGMRAVLIEAEPEYQADIRRRMALVLAGPDERARESIKAKNLPRNDGPLFGGFDPPAYAGRTVAAGFEGEERRRVPRDDGPLFDWMREEAAE